ncbi:MAG: glycosyltransferase family 39 protein [Microcoleaceae cyanobacterium]
MSKTTQSDRRQSKLGLELLFCMAIGLGVILRILFLDQREFWYDEVLSVLISAGNLNAYSGPDTAKFPVLLSNYTALLNLPITDTVANTLGNGVQDSWQTLETLIKSLWREPHPPLFYLGQHFWLRMLGHGVASTRSLNALISAATIGSSYGLGQVVLGHRGGLLLAALMALNPFFLSHSLNVRMYCPVVLWATLSAWALMHLIRQQKRHLAQPLTAQIGWNLLLVISVACGLTTLYFFAYFVFALIVLAVFLERNRAWRYLLPLTGGVLLTLPWMMWAIPQQLSNIDLNRFAISSEAGNVMVQHWVHHLTGFLSVLGNLFILGDWGADLPPALELTAGAIAGIIFLICIVSLSRQKEYPSLGTGLILGLLPLALAFGVDIATGKSTLPWGAGRGVIFILPGCLLLLSIWMELTAGRWRVPIALALLLMYGSISIGDYTLRQRTGMTTLARVIDQHVTQPTLIAMNARGWGHVMRLAYYINPNAAVMLLAKPTPDLIDDLTSQAQNFPRIVLLDSDKPSFSDQPATEAERQKIWEILQQAQMQFVSKESLAGTQDIDRFTMSVYERSPR